MREQKNSNEVIKEQNDTFRRAVLTGITTRLVGRVVCSPGVATLSAEELAALGQAVACFTDFNDDNDPYGEHDFGAVEVGDQRYFWKIDYFDRSSRCMPRIQRMSKAPRGFSRSCMPRSTDDGNDAVRRTDTECRKAVSARNDRRME